METPKKINEDIKNEISDYIFEHYNLRLNKLDYLAARIVKIFGNALHPSDKYGKSNMKRHLSTWFKTTNIRGEMNQHSCYGFASFIDKEYYLLEFNKKSLRQRIIYNIVKKIL